MWTSGRGLTAEGFGTPKMDCGLGYTDSSKGKAPPSCFRRPAYNNRVGSAPSYISFCLNSLKGNDMRDHTGKCYGGY